MRVERCPMVCLATAVEHQPRGRRGVRSALLVGAAVVFAATSAPRARAALAPDLMKVYGGTYQSNCADPRAPKVTVLENAVVFLDGDRRVATTNLDAQHSFYGNSPPEDYVVALASEAGVAQLYCIVYRNASGQWLKLDGDAAVMARIGAAAGALTYRLCGAAAKSPEVTGPRPATGSASPEGRTAGALLEDPTFAAVWRRALGPLAREPWLARLDGPSVETRRVRVAGTEYLLGVACKDHDCGDHNTVVLYSKARRVTFALVHRRGRNTLVGAPGAAVAKELERLWREQWGRGR